MPRASLPQSTPIAELLARRDEGNAAIAALLRGGDLPADVEALLRQAMRAEVEIELKNAPRPLFAEMSSGTES